MILQLPHHLRTRAPVVPWLWSDRYTPHLLFSRVIPHHDSATELSQKMFCTCLRYMAHGILRTLKSTIIMLYLLSSAVSIRVYSILRFGTSALVLPRHNISHLSSVYVSVQALLEIRCSTVDSALE